MNTFTTIRKNQKLVAFFFLSLITASEASAVANKTTAVAISSPVAASASQYVDPFTGDFNYSVPLLSVPGPNGENVPVTASYHAGIRMDQSASWIGLGWNLNPGEISRQVNGAPDDNNGKVSFSADFDPLTDSVHRNDNAIYGPAYYSAGGTPNYVLTAGNSSVGTCIKKDKIYRSHDTYVSSSNKISYNLGGYAGDASLPFASADYDNYSISGAGIRGSLQPYTNSIITLKWEVEPGQSFTTGTNSIKSMQFYFAKSADMSATTVETTTNRTKTGYFVRYLSNAELNNETNNDANGFIDYRTKPVSGDRRPTVDFEDDGIGAYQVTTPAGITYHYSLPVYTSDEQYISFGVTNSSPAFNKQTRLSRKRYKYATSWKLTAVTGSDYVDVNTNNIVDAADKGYWVAYDYALWCNDYQWASNMYGYRKDFQVRSFPDGVQGGQRYEQRGSVVSGTSQQYYLNKISTVTHTAFFVKSIRKDEQSMDRVYNSSNSPKPQLKLDKIVLLKNEDAALFNVSGTITAVSGYTTTGCNPNTDLIHDGIYTANATNINTASLKMVEFETDYSLCKKYYSNIAQTVTATAIDFSAPSNMETVFSSCNVRGLKIGHKTPTSVSTSTADPANAGGKLTLNKIKVYEVGKAAIYPSYEFVYNTSNNPDYNCDKTDIWGYYKSDYDDAAGKRSYYTTPTSKNYIDAWSLKSITTPLGGKISVNYESDSYVHEGGAGQQTEPYFLYLADNRTYSWPNNASMFPNEPDYNAAGSFVRRKLVIPNQSSCTGVFYEVTSSTTAYTQHIPDATLMCPSGITNPYNPTSGQTEWGWIQNWVSVAYGGGIRVKDITIEDPESTLSYKQEYTYEDGLCTYKPDRFKVGEYSITDNVLQNERDNGPAMVGYGKVTEKSISNNGQDNGKMVYAFNINYAASYVTGNLANTPTIIKHFQGFYRHNCSFTPSQGLNYCTLYYSDTQYKLYLSKTVGTYNGFGQLIKKSVYDRSDALISYSSNSYKTVNETTEFFKKDPQGYTNYIPTYYGSYCINPEYSTSGNITSLSCIHDAGTEPIYHPITYTNTVSYTVNANTLNKQYSVLDKTESYANGITTVSIVNERDPVSMQPISSTVIDPTQGAITTTIKPAYTNTVSYSGMGLKSACSTCSGNENMVSLVEEQRVIKQPVFRNTDGVLTYNSASPGILMGASKQTYASTVTKRKYNTSTNKYESVSEAANTYLPYESYAALTTSSTPSSTVTPEWKKTNTATLYTTTNKALETEGMSGRKSAVKYGYKNLYPLSSISDAGYNCFSFSSFEDTLNVGTGGSPVWHFGGEISGATMRWAGTNAVKPHTGFYTAAVNASTFGPGINLKGFEAGRTYRASIWVHKSSPDNAALCASLDGTVSGAGMYSFYSVNKNDAANIVVGDWILMSLNITVPDSYLESGGTNGFNCLSFYVWNTGTSTAYYDDLMIRPIDAAITGTVYDPKTARVIATLDNENFASWFEYDAAGRVTTTYTETRLGIKKISETQYNFSRAGQ